MTTTGVERELREAFIQELTSVAGGVIEAAASASVAAEAPTDGWTVTIQASHGARGSWVLLVDRAGAEELTRRATEESAAPADADIVRTLTEVCGDAATAVAQKPVFARARLTVASVAAGSLSAPEHADVFDVAGTEWTMRVAIAGDVAPAIVGDAPVVPDNPALDVILDVDLPLVVRFGRTEMTLKSLAALGPGSVIDLGRSPDEPVEVLVSNQLLARGEVVIVGGSYGVRITDVRTPAERARSLEERVS